VIERLAKVVFWFGVIVSAGFFLTAVTNAIYFAANGEFDHAVKIFVTLSVLAALAFGLGWAVRYVVTGKQGFK